MSNTNTENLVLDLDSFQVEDRDGIQTVVFKALSGEEVLFQRNKCGRIASVSSQSVDGWSAAKAKVICIEKKLLPSSFIEKGVHHTVKKVSLQSSGPSAAELAKKPWMNEGAALAHAHQSDPHDEV